MISLTSVAVWIDPDPSPTPGVTDEDMTVGVSRCCLDSSLEAQSISQLFKCTWSALI